MFKLLRKFVLPLMLLASCAKAVPVEVPQAPCPLPSEPTRPVLSPGSVGDLVTLTPAEAVALGVYLRTDARWHQTAKVCIGIH